MNDRKRAFATLLAFSSSFSHTDFYRDSIPRGRTKKDYAPWAGEHLTKKQRKGKSFEEIQELRRLQWESKTCN